MPGRNLFLWPWKFRNKMVLELKTCTEGVPHAEARLAPTEVIAVALSILLFGKREHFHRQVPALNYLSYHANVFLAEIRKHNCESMQSRYGMHIT
ncbi:hypothetical protein PVAP13_4NG340201 [Panicum virgatum]|uniref:Uncharacterized protein n=1 Tax=Panicum virgatum TaxID=38727 RepID=A0A8T0TA74_PANVG|nr:hypothetical protein PVAP13_4NG340201 [Panicum virgatum]